jgi:hypothetical protein
MNLYSRNTASDQHVSRLPTGLVGELLRAPQNQEISIHHGGKVYVDSGRGMRDTGLRVPETALHAVIRLLVAASGGYLDYETPFANLNLACGARFHGARRAVAEEAQISVCVNSGMRRPASDFMRAAESVSESTYCPVPLPLSLIRTDRDEVLDNLIGVLNATLNHPKRVVQLVTILQRFWGYQQHKHSMEGPSRPRGFRPDFAVPKQRLAIFTDGDFSTGNPRSFRIPKSNVEYGGPKIQMNQRQDSRE